MINEYFEFTMWIAELPRQYNVWVSAVFYTLSVLYFTFRLLQIPVLNGKERVYKHFLPITAVWVLMWGFSLLVPTLLYSYLVVFFLLLPFTIIPLIIVYVKWGYDKWVTTQSTKQNPSTSQD